MEFGRANMFLSGTNRSHPLRYANSDVLRVCTKCATFDFSFVSVCSAHLCSFFFILLLRKKNLSRGKSQCADEAVTTYVHTEQWERMRACVCERC